MPQTFVPAIVAKLGVYIVGLFGATVGGGAALAIGSAAIALTAVSARRASRLRDSIDLSVPSGRAVMIRSTNAARVIAYGETLVGGLVTYGNSYGAELRALVVETVHTAHLIDSFSGWYIDGRWVPVADVDDLSGSGSPNGSVDADTASHGLGPIDGTAVMYLRGWLGTDGQAADTELSGNFSDIDSNHRQRGCAKTVARFDLIGGSEHVWQNRAPQNVTAVVKGKLVYDPRLDSTFVGDDYGAGSGAHRVATPSTWAWSDNPALCWADYRIDAALGAGWDATRIDYDSVAIAADACEVSVAIPGSTTEQRYRCNLTVDMAMAHTEIVDRIVETMGGSQQFYNGLWHVYAGVWPTPDFTLDADDLVAPIQFRKQPATQRGDRYNRVSGTFVDPDRLYTVNQFGALDDSTLQSARDDNQVMTAEIRLEAAMTEYQAQRIAFLRLRQATDSGVIVFPTGFNGLDIRVGDTGTVTIDELGWAAKSVRCVGWEYVEFQGVNLILKEDKSSNYADPAAVDYITRTIASVIAFPDRTTVIPFDGTSMIGDPFFSRVAEFWDGTGASTGDHLLYYWTPVISAPGGDHAINFKRTGGVTGGVVEMVWDTAELGSLRIISLGREYSRFVTGEKVRVSFRVRKTVTPGTPPTNGAIICNVYGGSTSGDLDAEATGSPFSLDETDVNAWTVDEWQEYHFEVTMTNVTKSLTQLGFVVIRIGVALWTEDITFEFDAVLPVRVSN